MPVTQPVKQGIAKVAIAVSAGLLAACAGTVSDKNRLEPGPYEVRRNEQVVTEDEQQGREVTFAVSWPATGGPFPVVVFSPGAFCYPQQYANVTDFWVSHGYIVIVPYHLDSPNGPKMKPDDLVKMQSSRVRDMSFALDSRASIEAILPDLQGRIDYARAAVAGHSFGSLIAMTKSGLRYEQPNGEPADFADSRFTAAVIMSGVGQMPAMPGMPQIAKMSTNAFAGLTGPLIASGGTLDEGNVGTGEIFPWQWRMSPYTESPPGDKYYLALKDADHYLGGLICRENRGGPADPLAVRIVRAAQTAFLDAYIKQDAEALNWLKTVDWAALSDGRASFKTK